MATFTNSAKSSARASEKSGQRLAVLVAMIAGYVDAYGFISYRAFLSFMSGNTTQSGVMMGEGDFSAATPTLVAIASFVVGVFAGTLLIYSETHKSRRLTLALVAVLLAVNIGVTLWASFGPVVSIATLGFAMGVMNTTLSRIGAETVNLTFITGTLNKMGSHLALALKGALLKDAQGPWDTHVGRASLLAGLWAGFLVGAVLAGVATPRFGVWVLLLPCLILLALAAINRAPSDGTGNQK